MKNRQLKLHIEFITTITISTLIWSFVMYSLTIGFEHIIGVSK